MIALITATGMRPKQMELCRKFMKHQDYTGPVLWILVDDGDPVTTDCVTDDFRKDWDIIRIYPTPKWEPGQNTQSRNLLAGFEVLRGFRPYLVFIIEDDDYYTPHYLREMVARVGDYDVIGEAPSIYYNVKRRGWLLCPNRAHSSLFQTAFKANMIPTVMNICRKQTKFIDMMLYNHFTPKARIKFITGLNLAIGIKGQPGRPGIGMGHKETLVLKPDPDLKKLKELIGDDYIYYL